MKKIFIACLVGLVFFTTSCKKKDNVDLEKVVSSIQLTGDLVTKKVYYHNVAEYDDNNFFMRLLGVDKKVWIEYTGLADLMIELGSVEKKVEGNKIYVRIPKTKISKVYVQNDNASDIVFYTPDGQIFNLGNVSSSEGTKALQYAQEKMTQAIKEDLSLLRMAQTRASRLIEEKIKEFASDSDYSYTIIWEYEDNA